MRLFRDALKETDVRLFLWLIPAINVINYYLTYSHVGSIMRVVATFSIDTLEGYVAWLLVRTIIKWLDKKISFDTRPVKRICIQITLTLLGGSGSIIILTEFVNWLATSQPVPLSFYTSDIIIISIWFFVANGIYVGLHYYSLWKNSEAARQKENEVRTSGFKVNSSRKDLLIDFDEIGGFYIDGEYSVLVTKENKKFLVDSSLDKVEKNLPAPYFFRLNRQFIVHRQTVTGYERSENGKINVLLKDQEPLPATISVSRTKAPDFKSWFVVE